MIGSLFLALDIQPATANGTIYIRADGSIDPPTAPISTLDNVTYTLTGDISDPLVIERSSIVVEGAGQRVMGIGAEGSIGMYLSGNSNVTLVNMEITGFSYGIRLYYSSNNTIASSNVTASGRVGIDLYYSSNNSMLGNNVAGNVYGISLEVSSNNRIHGNIFTNDGLCVRMSYANSVENNTVNGRPLVYLEDVSDYNVQEAGQVILVRCHNIMVDGLSISETDIGIQLLETNSSIIAENKLANNLVSMYLWGSLNNTISGNNISDNFVGIWLYCSSNTRIFHNNFNNNTQQTKIDPDGYNAWDDGYPSGGNYWSDYNGSDFSNGPYQNETGSDGIGDVPYVVDSENQDDYPLMSSWVRFESQTIYIRADGSVDPSGAPIHRQGETYTLTSSITTAESGIIVQRDNVVVDFAGHSIQCFTGGYLGVDLSGRSNVTLKNAEISNYYYCVYLSSSSNNTVTGNTIDSQDIGVYLGASSENTVTDNYIAGYRAVYLESASGNIILGNNILGDKYAVYLGSSYNNTVARNSIDGWEILGPVYLSASYENVFSENNMTCHAWIGVHLLGSNRNNFSGNTIVCTAGVGVYLEGSSYNRFSGNRIPGYYYGIVFTSSSNGNIVSGNNITNQRADAIHLEGQSTNNKFYHNNFMNNAEQVYIDPGSGGIWDDGYPSGGNYWSNFADVDLYSGPNQNIPGSDGIWDHPYSLPFPNVDHYPLVQQSTPDSTPPGVSILSPQNTTYTTNSVPLTFTIDERTSWIGYSLDNQANATVVGNTTLAGLSEGSHMVIVYANDSSGNMGPSLAVCFAVDTNVHDLAITKINTNRTVISEGSSLNVTVTVQNLGTIQEEFNVTVYANSTEIGTFLSINLQSGSSVDLTLTWDTTGFAKGNYAISGYAWPVLREANLEDNTLVDGWVLITIPGDVNGDKKVNILDCILISNHFGHVDGNGHTHGSKEWLDCVNCDINSDSKTNVLDCIVLSNNFGQSWT